MSEAAESRRERLVEVFNTASVCERCPLWKARTRVVFGAGNADAELMFVGEAPGAEEDRQGLPFVGRAGGLLSQMLDEIGMRREDVFIANVLKCLRYNVPVQLEDGSWERIGRLVRSRYAGRVMSVGEDGRLEPRRVVGWHATPVAGRRVYRVTYRSSKRAGRGRIGIELTGDHPVLTEEGYVRVDQLGARNRIATGQGLSELAWDVVCGTLLGDGSLSSRSASLAMSHSASQSEYALFKAQLLAELETRVEELEVAAVVGGPRAYPVVHVRTLAHRALGVLRRNFYRPKKVVPSWLANDLNERMLAIWFMDDGYMRVRPGGRQPLAEIATVGFDEFDLQILLAGLQRLGIAATASRGRIYFNVAASKALSERIAPYVPPSMRYKLHPEVAGRVPFQSDRLRPGPQKVVFDDVVVEDVTDRPRTDTTFFCIDVEGTHNFVTAGGVVHNCRPPGNRDPLPVEIESCEPYLAEQVRLIEPRVVCTLGNFATKLLTASRVGITKVRGTPQVHQLGGRTVFVMPLFHPAAALRTPAVAETLRSDFARLPELLAQPLPQADPVPGAEPVAAEAAEPPQLGLLD